MNKFFLLSFLTLSIVANIYAQKVSYTGDMIYVDDQPYAIMKKSGGIVSDYSIRTLGNKEIMIVHFDKGDGGSMKYLATFIGSGMQVFIKNDFGFGKKLAREVVENDLIKNGELNPAGERRFLMAHSPGSGDYTPNDSKPAYTEPETRASRTDEYKADRDNYGSGNDYNSTRHTETETRMSGTTEYHTDRQYSGSDNNKHSNTWNETSKPGTVDRDRGRNIYVAGDRIRQDNKLIGIYTKTSSASEGTIFNVFSFYLPDGTKIAEERITQFNSDHYKLITIYDNKVRMVSISPDINLDFDQVREMARYLADHYYL